MPRPSFETLAIAACTFIIASCAGRASVGNNSPEHSARTTQASLDELDRLIADMEANLVATRQSAQQSEAFAKAAHQKFIGFRDKVATGERSSHEAGLVEAVQYALDAFEARAAHAGNVFQLRSAQVEAREARLHKLRLERRLAQSAVDDPNAPRLERDLDAAKQKMAAAEARVAQLTAAERESQAEKDEAISRYRAVREGAPAEDDALTSSSASDEFPDS